MAEQQQAETAQASHQQCAKDYAAAQAARDANSNRDDVHGGAR